MTIFLAPGGPAVLATCWLTLACGLVAYEDPDPTDLVRRLGSDRFAERVEATRALEALGASARPALDVGKGSADPKVRDRAAALLAGLAERDEAARFFGATPIALDYRDRPLGEVLRDLNARYDLRLTLQSGPPSNRRAWGNQVLTDDQKARRAATQERPITLVAPAPVPFWEAIDRLCAAGELRHDLHPLNPFGPAGASFLLYDGLKGAAPVADSGAIRVAITGLHASWERDFSGATAAERTTPQGELRPTDRQLDLHLCVLPEPGRLVQQAGPIRLVEATDNRGENLVPLDQDDPASTAAKRGVAIGGGNQLGPAGFNLVAALRLPEGPSRSLRRLRGSIRVAVIGRVADPPTIRLSGAAGKSVRNDEVTMTVRKVKADPEQGVTVQLDVTANRPIRRANRQVPAPVADPSTYHPDQILNHLKLVASDGRELAFDPNKVQRTFQTPPPPTITVELTPLPIRDGDPVTAADPNAATPGRRPLPVAVRFVSFARRETEVQFDFRDVPLP